MIPGNQDRLTNMVEELNMFIDTIKPDKTLSNKAYKRWAINREGKFFEWDGIDISIIHAYVNGGGVIRIKDLVWRDAIEGEIPVEFLTVLTLSGCVFQLPKSNTKRE